MILLALVSLSLGIWVVLLLGRGDFWRVSKLQDSAYMRPKQRCKVVAIVPARDEAELIGITLDSLLKQDFDGELRVIVVDDNSSDKTGDVARATGATVISGAPLADGWTGKLWALQQGVAAAGEMAADFFLFTDADIRHDPYNVASLVGMAQARNLDLTSHMVKLHCVSWAERLTIPAFVFFFFKLYPPSWITSVRTKVAGAAGGCVLIRPSMLTTIGGLAAIRDEVIDDCSLARVVKLSGGRLWLGLRENTESIRPYKGLGEIKKMISRSAFRQLDHSLLLLAAAVLGLLVTYALPLVMALRIWPGQYVAIAAWVLMTICYLPTVRFYHLNPLWALSLPISACFYLVATVDSAIQYWRGHGGEWKGRAQDAVQ